MRLISKGSTTEGEVEAFDVLPESHWGALKGWRSKSRRLCITTCSCQYCLNISFRYGGNLKGEGAFLTGVYVTPDMIPGMLWSGTSKIRKPSILNCSSGGTIAR